MAKSIKSILGEFCIDICNNLSKEFNLDKYESAILFTEILNRNIVQSEIYNMAEYITENQKHLITIP